MTEQCPLNVSNERTYAIGDIPPRCAVCLGRAAYRGGIRRTSSELGIVVKDGRKFLAQKGLNGTYFIPPGEGSKSELNCDGSSMAESLQNTPIIDQRRVKTRQSDQVHLHWGWNKKTLGIKKEDIYDLLQSFANREYLAEEIANEIVEKLVLGRGKDNLSTAAKVLDAIEHILVILVPGPDDRKIVTYLLSGMLKDQESGLPEILDRIIDARAKLPRSLKKEHPFPEGLLRLHR
jgi:hypothetical protein